MAEQNVNSEDLKRAFEIAGELGRNDYETIMTILGGKERVTPWVVTELDDNEIFVFGCNNKGQHWWRSSAFARNKFGAVIGEYDKISGRTYPLSTTGYTGDIFDETTDREIIDNVGADKFPVLDGDSLKQNIKTFIDTAKKNMNKRFFVTRVGCGFADRGDEVIADWFKEALTLENVFLPQSFISILFGDVPKMEHLHYFVPSESTDVMNFTKVLEKQLSNYLAWVRGSKKNRNECVVDQETYDIIEKVCNAIAKAVKMMYRGLPAEAYKEIEKLFYIKDSYNYKVGCIDFKSLVGKCKDEDDVFFRLRMEKDNWAKKAIDKEGMFHIPLSMRGSVKTQRYSIPGYPCMYIGKRIENCWEELGRPNLNDCVVSKLIRTKVFNYLDLSIPTDDDLKSNDAKRNLLIMFPFVIASTFKINDISANFKPEYIVPQLMLQLVKDFGYKLDSNGIYGVKYTSVHCDKKKEGWKDFYTNYVIPVISIKSNHCERLIKLFKITDPKCFDELLISRNEGDSLSLFAAMENRLNDVAATEIEFTH